MADQPHVTLNDGASMPQFGLGVWQTPQEDAAKVVQSAIQAGYRAVDTAAIYRNERGVGEGVRAAKDGMAEGERPYIFITTKLWNEHQGYDSTLEAFDRSFGRLGLSTVDLYLIHWAAPERNLYVETWKALVQLQKDGRLTSIGVSNFNPDHLDRVIGETGVTPAVNQIELHPRFQQKALRAYGDAHGVKTESWSPLGQAKFLDDPTVGAIAAKHGKSPAQVVIRWHLDSGLIVIPKTINPDRLRENIAVFDFTLDADDMAKIEALDRPDGRLGPDPASFS